MKRFALALIALTVLALTACSAVTPKSDPSINSSVMLAACISKVAQWASISKSDVTGSEVNEKTENPSGVAWDFNGTFSGGTWKCGGAAVEPIPASVMVYPNAGGIQDIVNGGSPPAGVAASDSTEADPVAILASLVEKSEAPSQTCLESMSALASTSPDATDTVSNAAVAATSQACQTAGEYILAYKKFPAAWGTTDASYIDGKTALITIQSACYGNRSAPTCVDARAHGLL